MTLIGIYTNAKLQHYYCNWPARPAENIKVFCSQYTHAIQNQWAAKSSPATNITYASRDKKQYLATTKSLCQCSRYFQQWMVYHPLHSNNTASEHLWSNTLLVTCRSWCSISTLYINPELKSKLPKASPSWWAATPPVFAVRSTEHSMLVCMGWLHHAHAPACQCSALKDMR
jgi:hypothetical protein